ncbi:MAG: glycosyltransferase family 2 protein [Actinomyces ruminicola]|nr:glycosyltransferase family 2 protein [Actinomyces ruminicola]
MSQAGGAGLQYSSLGGTLAVLVSAGVTPYLPKTLRAVAGQTVAPDVLLIVDVASRNNGLGDGTPIEEAAVDSGADAVTAVRVVHVPDASGFGDAVKRGLAKYAELVARGNRKRRRGDAGSRHPGQALASTTASGQLTGPTGAMSPISETEARRVAPATAPGAEPAGDSWIWLLHDDSAPEPGCLEALLTAVRSARSVALAGPKQVDWDNPRELLEVGLRTTASARRANDVVEGEVDQGQHDDRSDMLAVGTAGALIDRAVWDEVDGISPAFPVFDDGLELSRAVRLAGHRVVVVPDAVLRHRRASYLGLRPAQHAHTRHNIGHGRDADGTADAVLAAVVPEPDPDRSFRARRIAQLTAWATFSARPVPLLLTWIVLLGVARGAWRLLTKAPALAGDELAAALAVARRGTDIRRGRKRLAAHQSLRRSVLAELYVSAADIRAVRRDRRRQERERAAREAARSELELRELAALTRRRRITLAATLIAMAAVAAVGLSQVLVTRTVTGGALPGLGANWRELWDAAWSTWAVSGDGYPAALNPLLAMLALPVAVGSWIGADGDALVHLLVILAIPLGALGAWYAAGTITRRNPLRAWAACVWALAPTLLLAIGQGRLTAIIVHLALPWALTALARAVGADRRDVVLSGMVGAHHTTEQERDELDRLASARIEDLAELADPVVDTDGDTDGDADAAAEPAETAAASEDDATPVGSDAAADAALLDPDAPILNSSEAHAPDTSVPSPEAESPEAPAARSEADEGSAPVLPQSPEKYGPGSPTAAAVAGLLFSLIVAAAPATAALVVLGLILLGMCMRRSARRLLLTLMPVVATAAPAWWRALRLAQAGAAADAVRYLLTDTGLPVAVAPPSTIETFLGMPVDVESLIADPRLALAAKALLAIVPAAAVCGLLTGGRRGNRARAGLLMALGGLGLAACATRVITAVGTQADGSGSLTVTAWAGTGASVALAGLLTAALAAGDAAYTALPAGAVGWRHWARVGTVGVSVIAIAAPLGVGGAWALAARGSTGTGADALGMALRPAGSQIPVIAAEVQSSDAAGRVLVLSATDAGLRARIWRGDGVQLADVTPDVLAAQLAARVPAATAVGSPGASDPTTAFATALMDPADAELADLVVRAAAGQDEDVADALAAHGIAVVLLTDAAGDDLTASTRAGLEATPGLEQLARTDSGTSWRVSPDRAAESARATLVAVDGTGTTIPADTTGRTVIRTTLEASSGRRILVLAERSDGAWRATLNGEALEATTVTDAAGRWRTAFVVPADGGELVVTHGTVAGAVAARGIQVVWILTALIALPLRRRRSTT